MKRKLSAFILLTLSLLLINKHSFGQIIDDTTKLLYGPKTVLRLYEQDVLKGRYEAVPIDTSVNNQHNERYWYNDTSFYQHLGNIGTAATPIYFRVQEKIGVRLGKNIFDRYAYDPHKIAYYDTRSPYTHLKYVQGGRGETVFEALHTRNINPRWNFGVAYQILSANQQIGPASRNRQLRDFLDNQAVKVFTHYRSKNEKYDLFFNFTTMKVEQVETGGIDTTIVGGRGSDELEEFEEAPVYLNQAINNEARNNFHLTHIYRLAKENLKVYHTFDYGRQLNEYVDDALPRSLVKPASYLYPSIRFDSTRTRDATNYKELENTFGLTGNNKLSSYNAYVKLRNANMEYSAIEQVPIAELPDTVGAGSVYQDVTTSGNENQVFIGGDIRLFYKELAELTGTAEYQLAGDYRIKAMARIGGAYGSLERVNYSPSRVQRFMLSNHYIWKEENDNIVTNDFGNTSTNRFGAGLHQKIGKRQYLKLDGNFTIVERWIYFNESAQPEQATGDQRFWGASLAHKINFGPLYFDNYVVYTNTDEAEFIPMPDWLVESKIYLQGPLFKHALFAQLGVQGTYMSEYYGYGYMPVIQQFYVQRNFAVQGYPVAEVFLNADIKSVNVFLKMSHINQGLTEPVYFLTPLYPGLRRSFTFGVTWRFFD